MTSRVEMTNLAAGLGLIILLFLYKQHQQLQMFLLHTREGYSICKQTGSHTLTQ